ncbi:MAG: NlpC/P60 family protein [Thermodesulfobacteriota bacterium]|nr:NlpC/P60 family protein [Thermodesulfobacteriota bacterium]
MLRRESRIIKLEWKWSHIFGALSLILLVAGCGRKSVVSPGLRPEMLKTGLARMGYSIQIGAFSNLDNAVRLTKALENRELNAYYFAHKTGLYKVRFGNFPSRETARRKAESTRAAGIIDEYYIVSPNDYAVVKERKYGRRYLRNEIVETAESFIGLPYRWGGSSVDDGFDCSGLAMAVYRLNGLNLPRSSREQYRAGIPIKQSQLKRGDLVFFATSRGKKVSHVGIYTGDNKFIHAPGKGKKIRTASLSNRYFKTRYAGAKTYLW